MVINGILFGVKTPALHVRGQPISQDRNERMKFVLIILPIGKDILPAVFLKPT